MGRFAFDRLSIDQNDSGGPVLATRLKLSPRLVRGGHIYDVKYLGETIVRGSPDPEHDAARALVARGIVGIAVTVDATGAPRMRFDIETFAGTRTVERDRSGLSIEPWRRWLSATRVAIATGRSHPRTGEGSGEDAPSILGPTWEFRGPVPYRPRDLRGPFPKTSAS